jgi:non-heme chloroperoxidase
VTKAVLVSAVPPIMVKSADQPRRRAAGSVRRLQGRTRANRAQFFIDVPTGPFYGFNRPGAKVSEG